MYKKEKQIVDNPNLATPQDSVLDKARAAMAETKKPRKFGVKQAVACAVSCAVVLIVVLCIPYMMPAQNALPTVPNDQLQGSPISFVADYVAQHDLAILFWQPYDTATVYAYLDRDVLLEQTATVGDTHISMLVDLYDDVQHYQKYQEYTADCASNQALVADTVINWRTSNDTIYVSFAQGDHSHAIRLWGDISDWQTLVENLLLSATDQ